KLGKSSARRPPSDTKLLLRSVLAPLTCRRRELSAQNTAVPAITESCAAVWQELPESECRRFRSCQSMPVDHWQKRRSSFPPDRSLSSLLPSLRLDKGHGRQFHPD